VSYPRIGIFVVAYNAIEHLIPTLQRIPKSLYDSVEEIFIIDDCSKDNTYYAALGYKHEHLQDKLLIMRNEQNQGYGGNQKRGYEYAISRGFDFVVLLHGDGQYAPEVMPAMLSPLVSGDADLVLGSRMLKRGDALRGGMPLYKFFGNKILTTAQNALTGFNLSEYHSGYRAYRVEALKKIPFKDFSNTWHFDTQMILAFGERKFRINEVPIPTYYGNEICHVNGIPYAWNCLIETYNWSKKSRP